jgi:DNA-binding transcriptional LysR family regulator
VDFNLKLLLVFQALMRTRNVGLAAKSLNMSQPSVSRSLNSLRAHFNDKMFVRTHSGMMPTPCSLEMASTVDEMLELYHSRLAQPHRFDPMTSQRTFKIATSEIGHAFFLPRLINRFENNAPHASLKGVPLGLHSLIEELETGETDVAIGSFPKLYAGVYERTLFKANYVCLVRSGHPYIKRTLSLERFQQSKHIIASAKGLGHIHGQIEKQIFEACPKENIQVVSHSFFSCALIALQTDYILTLPSKILVGFGKTPGFRVFEPPMKLPSFDVKQYWHERYHQEPSNRWIRNQIVECIN